MPRKPTGKRSTTADGSVTVHGKVGNGEGSVYFAADDRWRASYRVPGEARARTVSAPTREKVIAKRAQKLEELANAPASPLAPSAVLFRQSAVAQRKSLA